MMYLPRMFVERDKRRNVLINISAGTTKKNQEDISEDCRIFNVIAEEELDSGRNRSITVEAYTLTDECFVIFLDIFD